MYIHFVNQFLQGLIIATGFLSHNYIELQMKVIVFKMKTLHIISLNSCFVSIHVVVRFTHGYRDFVADNDCDFFYSNPRSIQASTPEKRVPCVARAQE